MPFESEAQRRWMWANDPEMAERWATEGRRGSVLTADRHQQPEQHRVMAEHAAMERRKRAAVMERL